MDNQAFFTDYTVRWADVDANQHLRHSAYADYAAQTRILLLEKHGFSFGQMAKLKIGPILFREETRYLREVPMNAHIRVTAAMLKARKDASRWTIQHKVLLQDGTEAAHILVDGAWMDLAKRKLAQLPDEVVERFLAFPKAPDFNWE